MRQCLIETSLFAIKIIDFPVFDESVTNGRTDGPTDGPTDRPTDGRTDTPSYRDARTHLKTDKKRRAAKRGKFLTTPHKYVWKNCKVRWVEECN